MKLTVGNHFFPHPVLGNREDIQSTFSFSLNPIKKTSSEIQISGTVSLTNNTILEMLQQKTASCYIHIESSATFFRKCEKIGSWSSNITPFEVQFKLKDLRGNIDINLFCISNIDQNNYRPEGLSPKYGAAKFQISKGSILSFAKQKSYSCGNKKSLSITCNEIPP